MRSNRTYRVDRGRLLGLWTAFAVAFTSSAWADYTMLPLVGGESVRGVVPGESFVVDILLTSDNGDMCNSAIFRIVLSEPGLVYESYTWSDPYVEGTIYDDSVPLLDELPLMVDELTLTGPGYPDGVADVELSNVDIDEFYGEGIITTLTFQLPIDHAGDESLFLFAVPDTLADGFDEIETASPGGLEIIPTVIEDVTRDGVVSVEDLLEVILNWGVCKDPEDCAADIDGDGFVGVEDLIAIVLAWG